MEYLKEMNKGRSLECADSEARRLIQRAAPLTLGVFGTIGSGTDGTEERSVLAAGSGIIVAPFLAITALHVVKDLYRLEGRDMPRRPHQSWHEPHLFQVLEPFNPDSSPKSLWQGHRYWASPHTDIAVLQISAENEVAKELQIEVPSKFFEWFVLPPPVGSIVWAIGFPQADLRPDGRHVNFGVPFALQELHVTRIFPQRRDRGMLNFPCFEVQESIDHGFSGGPVFFQGRLCGIVVSGSSFDSRSYIASLWPITLLDYGNEFGQHTSEAFGLKPTREYLRVATINSRR